MNNKALLESLYLENREQIAIYIKSKIYSKEQSDVDDCVQETFMIAIKKSLTADLGEHPNIKGWLFKVAKNVIAKFNIARMKTKEKIDKDVKMDLIIDGNDPINQLIEDLAYEEFDIETLRSEIIGVLTESERVLFDLRVKGLSFKEISNILHKTEDAVGSKYRRIRQKLEIRLKKSTFI